MFAFNILFNIIFSRMKKKPIIIFFFSDFPWFQTKWGFVYQFTEPWVYCKITWTYCKKWQSTNHHGLCRYNSYFTENFAVIESFCSSLYIQMYNSKIPWFLVHKSSLYSAISHRLVKKYWLLKTNKETKASSEIEWFHWNQGGKVAHFVRLDKPFTYT